MPTHRFHLCYPLEWLPTNHLFEPAAYCQLDCKSVWCLKQKTGSIIPGTYSFRNISLTYGLSYSEAERSDSFVYFQVIFGAV